MPLEETKVEAAARVTVAAALGFPGATLARMPLGSVHVLDCSLLAVSSHLSAAADSISSCVVSSDGHRFKINQPQRGKLRPQLAPLGPKGFLGKLVMAVRRLGNSSGGEETLSPHKPGAPTGRLAGSLNRVGRYSALEHSRGASAFLETYLYKTTNL